MNKKLRPRELIWMTLPVVLLGGAAWWFNQQAQLRVGPPRLLPLQWERVPVLPYDVAKGYTFATKTTVQLVGEAEVPDKFGFFVPDYSFVPGTFALQYRKEGAWHNATTSQRALVFSVENMSGKGWHKSVGLTTKFDLRAVPRDAKEVRVTGTFVVRTTFQAPSSWVPPSPVFQADGTSRGPFRLWSSYLKTPFQVGIKSSDEPFPNSQVSRAPGLQVVDAKWIVDPNRPSADLTHHTIALQLRRIDESAWREPYNLFQEDVHLFDAAGHEIQLLDLARAKTRVALDTGFQGIFSANHPASNIMVLVCNGARAPKSGWDAVKSPLRLRATINTEQGWPQKIDVQIPRVEMKLSDFGDAK